MAFQGSLDPNCMYDDGLLGSCSRLWAISLRSSGFKIKDIWTGSRATKTQDTSP